MKKVLLVCMAGMSTAFLVQEVNKLAKQRKMGLVFNEAPFGSFKSKMKDVSLVCVAPQIKFNFDQVKKEADKINVPTYQIKQKEYVPIYANDLLDNIEKLL